MVLNYEIRFELRKMILSFSKRVELCLGLGSLKYLTMGQMIKVSNQLSKDLVRRLSAGQEDFWLETCQRRCGGKII